jgi:tetratricopeptide (TPR) repeat protein
MKRFLIAASFAVLTCSVFALPSADAVQAQISQGNYLKAEEMMREVVAAKPDSAKARYVYAELLAHNKRFGQAVEEVASAKRIDPALKFAQPEKFKAFVQLLEREQAAEKRAVSNFEPAPVKREAPPASSGLPSWIWALGGGVLALTLWKMFTARQKPPVQFLPPAPGMQNTMAPAGMPQGFGGGGGGGGGGGYGPGYGQPQGGMGSGLLGTGLAVAGGVAAGMMLEKMLDGGHGQAANQQGSQGQSNYSPGVFDEASNSAASELEQRPIDMGTGSGWDSGDSGGSFDGGGDSGGDW